MAVNYPDDDQIDSDLKAAGFDSNETYPEYGHSSLREAYTAGFETAAFDAMPSVAGSVADLSVLPEHSALLFADGALREIRRNDRFATYLGAFDGSKVVNDLRIATLLPATVIWRPAT